ncbi:outer membrane receptor protein [Caulobacter sp. AP07]|uniref:TonB-dependent receptor n=1 Tax=Caulobacter sp. AP07 TaxID=1144304 RepID=UPI0002720C7D|nr:TonB-dependent receptor [Caulobacter sp. AP07]EJL25233.1 outer membrane receptor protein [Caulobacter sp. AP07]
MSALLAAAPAALAQNATGAAASVDEIVVTAQRREQRLQDVPIAIGVVTPAIVEKAAMKDLQDLGTYVPGLTTGSGPGMRFGAFKVRGIGSGGTTLEGSTAVPVFIDDIYMGRPGLNNLALLDIERVEVAKGPQGTLFGRNTIGGAIAVVSRKPVGEFEAYAEGQLGPVEKQITGVVNLPISDRVMTRVAAQYDDSDARYWNSYKRTHVGAEKTVAVRGQVKVLASDDLTFLLSADLGNLRGDSLQQKNSLPLKGNTTPGFHDPISQNADTLRKVATRGVSLRADWALEAATLSSITGYRYDQWFVTADTDRTSLSLLREQNPQGFQQYSQEFRAVSNGGGPLSWLAGASYYRERAKEDMTITAEAGLLNLFGISAPPTLSASQTRSQRQVTESAAVFGEANYALTERLKVTAGLRYTYDSVDQQVNTNALTSPFTAILGKGVYQPTVGTVYRGKTFSKLTPRVAIDYRFTPDVLAYFSVTNGYKSGGFDAGRPADPAYAPEEVWSYEGGLKSEWFDRKLRVNLAAYAYDYKNLLTRSTINNALVLLSGKVKSRGIESDITFKPVRGLTLTSALSYQKPEYGDYIVAGVNYRGNRLAGANAFTSFHSIDYEFDVKDHAVALRAEHQWIDKAYSQPSNAPQFYTGDASLVNLRAAVTDPSGKYEVAVFGKNVFNQRYYLVNGQLSAGLVHNFVQSPGGYWGFQFKARY